MTIYLDLTELRKRQCISCNFLWSFLVPFFQGRAQGCLTGICSFAHIVSPFVFSPLTGKLNFFLLLFPIKIWTTSDNPRDLNESSFDHFLALFLSERAPFYFPGFSILCAAFAGVSAYIHIIIHWRNQMMRISYFLISAIFDYLVFTDASLHSKSLDKECWTRNEALHR